MILYLDTSALAKRYVEEAGSEDVLEWMNAAHASGTALVTRPEVAAAITRGVRMKTVLQESAATSLSVFRAEWDSIAHIPITEQLIARADLLACEHGLRGYDAVHLACALIWQEALAFPVTLATYDLELAEAAKKSGMVVLPAKKRIS